MRKFRVGDRVKVRRGYCPHPRPKTEKVLGRVEFVDGGTISVQFKYYPETWWVPNSAAILDRPRSPFLKKVYAYIDRELGNG